MVTEGNACGAISWKNPGNRTKYQEIATSGYALLAMTRKIEPGASAYGAEAATPGGVALRLIYRKNGKMSTDFENSVDKSREKALLSLSIHGISRQNRKKLHRLFKVCGECLTPEFLLTLPEDLAILFMKSGATGSRFPTECYKK